MGKRIKILLIALPVLILAILTGWFLFGQTPQAIQPAPSTPSNEAPEEQPPDVFVVPEVPLGSLAIVLACFSALLIAQRKTKSPLPLKI